MYRFVPSDIDSVRASFQAEKNASGDSDAKRIGNLGEIAFERFCREYLPVEMWEWMNEDAIRRCNPESYCSYDFEAFGYEIDVKTSRDVSAFLPKNLVKMDSDDDIIVMAWHRDNEDALILLGWERVETLESKARTESEYTGDSPAKLDHIAVQEMNSLPDLGPNTAHMNQTPDNPFEPGDRVVKASDDDASMGVVIEVMPPENTSGAYGTEIDGEAVNVTFPDILDEGPGNWKSFDVAKLASYCDDQNIRTYTYKHTNLEFAETE